MNKTLEIIINNYGAETVVTRIMEQLRLIAECDSEDGIKAVKEHLSCSGCDTEYIYTLCEYTNLMSYVSENTTVTDTPWNDEDARQELLNASADVAKKRMAEFILQFDIDEDICKKLTDQNKCQKDSGGSCVECLCEYFK